MCLKVINDRNMKGGMGSETNPLKFMDQDYNFLQDYCLKTRQRFVDEFFPPDVRSIGEGLLKPDVMAKVEWIRPTVLYPNAAEFIVQTVSRFDYAQGNVGMSDYPQYYGPGVCPTQCPAEFSSNQLQHTCLKVSSAGTLKSGPRDPLSCRV
uniref:Calpain catalytic domain-containing protein n=1 Tax=Sinocyclocheilus grahami TaxID=75366 RepID=A0A672ND08_SINGR